MGRARLQTISAPSRDEFHDFIRQHVQPGATICTDGLPAYGGLGAYHHVPLKKTKEDPTVMSRLHVIVANLKMWLRGTYNSLPSKHLQRYLDEFTFRFNRR